MSASDPSSGTPTVAVVGGGIAGLAAAWELVGRRPAPRVVVLEAAGRLGGKIESADFGGRRVPLGPDAMVARRPEAVALCEELGLGEDLVAPGARTAWLWCRGRLRRLPPGLALGVPTRLGQLAGAGILSTGGLGRVAADLLTPPWRPGPATGDDEAIGPLLARRLGREVVDTLADPLLGGIHAGTVDTLSTAAVFPPLLEAARRGGSLLRNLRRVVPAPAEPDTPVFLTVRGGLARLVERLAESLAARGVELRTGSALRALERRPGGEWLLRGEGGDLEADAVVLALPAPAAAAAVRQVDDELARLLDGIAYASVALVTLRFSPAHVGRFPEGSGFLVPRSGGGLLTACTWLSSKWPELARPDDVLVRVSAGRFGDERPDGLDDEALVRRAVEELTPAMALTGPPVEARVTRFPCAFPQYAVGHLARVEAMEQAADRAGALAIAGALLRGVGIPACIASGRRAASSVLGRLALARSR